MSSCPLYRIQGCCIPQPLGFVLVLLAAGRSSAITLQKAIQELPANTTEVRLPNRSLTGTIPDNLADLFNNLTVLDLSQNNLEGPIPEGLGKAVNLVHVDLSYNKLSGILPHAVGNWTSLRFIKLRSNQFTGPLPAAVGRWRHLETFWCTSNHFTGRLPEEIGQWSKLRFVALGNNHFIGSIPMVVAAWSAIEEVWFYGNKFSGTIPTAVANWGKIRNVDFENNELSGPLPQAVGSWTEVQQVYMRSNSLNGTIPDDVGLWTKVQIVDLAKNKISGSIPQAVGSWIGVNKVDFDDNELSGPLPQAVRSWTQVQRVNFRDNHLNGTIPNAVGGWSNLLRAIFKGNKLTGPIPTDVENWANVEVVDFADNKLIGPIPAAVSGWAKVRVVDFWNNMLSGSIPSVIGQWSAVFWVNFARNAFTGKMPEEVAEWTHLEHVNFASNNLTGPIPDGIANWTGVVSVNLGNNSFSGEVPSGIGKWSKAIWVDLGNNDLRGALPPLLGSLEELKLEGNRLRGLPDLRGLPRLRRLYAQRNAISSLGSLPPSLEELDLRFNGLTALPEVTFDLKELQVLLVADNRLGSWPLKGVYLSKMMLGVREAWCNLKPVAGRFQWTKLTRLDASNNAMKIPAQYFLSSLAYVHSLTDLACRNCSLEGVLQEETAIGLADDQEKLGDGACVGYEAAKKGFAGLLSLDLANNSITAIEAEPSPMLMSVDFSGNALTKLDPLWYNLEETFRVFQLKIYGNRDLRATVRRPEGSCKTSGSRLLVADPFAYEDRGDGSECTSLCPGSLAKYSHDEGLSLLSLCRCRAGFQGEGRNCSVCPKDSYSHSSDQYQLVRECRPCPEGSATKGPQQNSISACRCPVGRYLDKAAAACARCRQWPFRSTKEEGAEQASACACNASYSGLKEADGFCGCDDGWHMNKRSMACEQCSNAETCLWGTRLNSSVLPPQVKAGFWAEPVSGEEVFGRSSIWRCTSQKTCLAGGVCAEGRSGRACGLCQARMYGRADGACKPCSRSLSPRAQRWLLGGLALALFVPAIIVLHVGLVEEGSSHLELMLQLRAVRSSLKQTVKHLQTVSVIGGFSVSWPPLAKAAFEKIDLVTIRVATNLAVGCLEEQTSASLEMAAKWAMPVIFVLASALALPASRLISRARQGLTAHGKLAASLPSSAAFSMTLPDIARVLLFCIILFWSTLVANSLEILTCVPSPNGELTVKTYPHIQCSFFSAEFRKLSVVALVTVVLYLLMPLRVLYNGYQKSRGELASTCFTERGWYSFIFDDFRDGHMIWTLLIMVKDALFVIIPACLPGQGAFQLLLTAALSIFHTCMVVRYAPYKDRSNSLLEAWNGATAAALCIYSVGMGYETTAGMDDIAQLFQEGVEDPMYKGRAIGMVIVQVVSITFPSSVLLFQLLCALERTRKFLPRRFLPVSQRESEEWIEDFVAGAELGAENSLAPVLKAFDNVDLYVFRSLFEQTTATRGYPLSRLSLSALVQEAEAMRENITDAAISTPPDGNDPVEGWPEHVVEV